MKRPFGVLFSPLLVAILATSCTSNRPLPNSPGSPVNETPSATPSTIASAAPSSTVRAPRIPAGTYQFDVTLRDLLRIGGGIPGLAVEGNTGHYTVTIRGGRWRLVHTADHPVSFTFMTGGYTQAGHEVVFELQSSDSAFGTGSAVCRWTFNAPRQLLTLEVLSAEPAAFVAAARVLFHLWRKTG